MREKVNNLLLALKAGTVPFSEVISFIEAVYQHQPTGFKNGAVYNDATQNQGSAKVFAFAKMNDLSVSDTLNLFAEHYTSVLENPEVTDHQNIRQFMINGWDGVVFEGNALTAK